MFLQLSLPDPRPAAVHLCASRGPKSGRLSGSVHRVWRGRGDGRGAARLGWHWEAKEEARMAAERRRRTQRERKKQQRQHILDRGDPGDMFWILLGRLDGAGCCLLPLHVLVLLWRGQRPRSALHLPRVGVLLSVLCRLLTPCTCPCSL